MAQLEIREAAGEYADGAEHELFELITSVEDRSVGSLELRALIHDWPTRYHLTHRRGELLRPLTFAPGARVLEIGAGAGAITRWLGEQDLEVVAVEGSLARAEIAAERCADLDNVRVIGGRASDLADEPPFDAVLLIGVVEYGGVGGFPEPHELLATAVGLVAPGGVLVMAIENQLGVEYLAGAPEDHRMEPYSGTEGYRRSGPRTWSRKVLRQMLADAGVAEQSWLFPFPDYKIPVSVLSERAYDVLPELGEGPGAVTAMARSVVSPHHHLGWRYPYDIQMSHEVFVEAGMGPDTANSFLIVAGREPGAVDGVVDPDALAWLLCDERLPTWIAPRVVLAPPAPTRKNAKAPKAPVVRSLLGSIDRQSGWLGQEVPAEAAYLTGTDLGRLATTAAVALDEDGLDVVLRSWRDTVDLERIADVGVVPSSSDASGASDVANPFAGADGEALLPADCLDIDLGNFVRRPDGTVERIDREWRASGPVSRELVMVRALWNFARALAARGIVYAGSPDAVVDDVAFDLLRRAGVPVVPAVFHRWRKAERELQMAAIGSPSYQAATWLDGGLSVSRLAAAGLIPRSRAIPLGLP